MRTDPTAIKGRARFQAQGIGGTADRRVSSDGGRVYRRHNVQHLTLGGDFQALSVRCCTLCVGVQGMGFSAFSFKREMVGFAGHRESIRRQPPGACPRRPHIAIRLQRCRIWAGGLSSSAGEGVAGDAMVLLIVGAFFCGRRRRSRPPMASPPGAGRFLL